LFQNCKIRKYKYFLAMTRVQFLTLFVTPALVLANVDPGTFVDDIYTNIAWRYSDQNFLKNVALFYDSMGLTKGSEGGDWHVLRRQFQDTQNLSQSSFQSYYKQIKEKYKVDWNTMSYDELDKSQISCLAMMMYVQKLIEVEGISPGWGDVQCKFLQNHIATTINVGNCMTTVGNIDGEYYQKVYQPSTATVHPINLQFDFIGNLENQVLGLQININSFTHKIIAGFSVDTDCTKDYRRPGQFDVLAHNETTVIKFVPTWNETDDWVSCDEHWVNKKETVCAAVWILDHDSATTPEFQVSVSQVRIEDDEMRRGISPDPKRLKALKSASEINLCDLEPLTESNYELAFENSVGTLLGKVTCDIDYEGGVDCMHGYTLTPEDCQIVPCGPSTATIAISSAVAGGIFVLAVIAFAIFYFVKKKRDGPVYSEPSNIISNRPQKNNGGNDYDYS
jgi:hypothetical protein